MGLGNYTRLDALPPDGYEYAWGYQLDEWHLMQECTKQEAERQLVNGHKAWRRPVQNWEEWNNEG